MTGDTMTPGLELITGVTMEWYGTEGAAGGRAWDGEQRSWESGERGDARLYGEGGELGLEATEEEDEECGGEEERLLTDRSTGSSWFCVGLLGL